MIARIEITVCWVNHQRVDLTPQCSSERVVSGALNCERTGIDAYCAGLVEKADNTAWGAR